MRTCVMLVSWLVAACGGSSYGTDPGHGTATLLVNGDVGYEGGAAHFDVHIQRAGANVSDAQVLIGSNFGVVTLITQGGGDYTGVQAGWGDGFNLDITAGNDSLSGGIDAPNPVDITSPNPAASFDPHTAPNGLVHVVWAGDRADTARVKSKDWDMTLTPDTGSTDIPATTFVDDHQDIEIRRTNTVDLAGGAPGSTLSAHYNDQVTINVTNPF